MEGPGWMANRLPWPRYSIFVQLCKNLSKKKKKGNSSNLENPFKAAGMSYHDSNKPSYLQEAEKNFICPPRNEDYWRVHVRAPELSTKNKINKSEQGIRLISFILSLGRGKLWSPATNLYTVMKNQTEPNQTKKQAMSIKQNWKRKGIPHFCVEHTRMKETPAWWNSLTCAISLSKTFL